VAASPGPAVTLFLARRIVAACFGLLVLPGLGAADTRAQDLTGGLQSEGTSYHVFTRPGQNTIQVMVLGSGIQAGLYEIGEGTDLAQLVALSSYEPGVRRARDERVVTIQLYRDNARGQRRLAYDSSLDRLVATQTSYPTLQAGDIVRVEVVDRERFSWRDGLQIFTAAAAIALTLERLSRVF
jgi:hypothetical protein